MDEGVMRQCKWNCGQSALRLRTQRTEARLGSFCVDRSSSTGIVATSQAQAHASPGRSRASPNLLSVVLHSSYSSLP